LLLVVTGGLSWEALKRLLAPQPVESTTVIAAAALAILFNGFTAWLFASGRKGDLNIRGAFLHMLADAAISAGVVVGGVLILLTGWLWLDPLIGLAINAIIIWGSWGLLRESVAMSLNAAPRGVETEEVRQLLSSKTGVSRVHDLHIWCMSTTDYALTAHLVMPSGHPGDGFLSDVSGELSHRFGIGHVTLQVETNPETECKLEAACKRK
jgi:cobalt-zinc-cadmium efflux system protein